MPTCGFAMCIPCWNKPAVILSLISRRFSRSTIRRRRANSAILPAEFIAMARNFSRFTTARRDGNERHDDLRRTYHAAGPVLQLLLVELHAHRINGQQAASG